MVIKRIRRFIITIGFLAMILFWAAVILWAAIIVVFIAVKVRNSVQRKRYSVRQTGEVATEYKQRGLH